MKRTTIRGVKIIREHYVPPNRVEENLKYTVEVFDGRGNFIEWTNHALWLEVGPAAA